MYVVAAAAAAEQHDYAVNLIPIYASISVCLQPPRSVLMIWETARFEPKKLVEGQNLHLSEHGIGYSDLAFVAYRGRKRPTFSWKPCKQLGGFS